MFNYSIIIPHKNIPSLLRRCLDSIPERDDLEIIVVDDNSKEDTIRDLQTIHRNNLQIIYTKEGKGAGYARNVGISKAQGKWILFADADDFYEKEFNTFLNDYRNSNVDCIYFSVTSVNSDTYEKSFRDFLYDDYIAKYNPMKPHSEEWIMFNKWEPWNKMISRDLILRNHLKFEEISKCNDMIFSLMVSLFTKKFLILKQKLYCVTFCDRSMTFHRTSIWEFRDCINAFKRKNIILRNINHPEWEENIQNQHTFFLKKEGRIHYLKCYLFYLLCYIYDRHELKRFRKTISNYLSIFPPKTQSICKCR